MKFLVCIVLFMFASLAQADVAIQALDMSDADFQRMIDSNNNYVSFSQYQLFEKQIWNSKFDELVNSKEIKDTDQLKHYLQNFILIPSTRNKLTEVFKISFWRPNQLSETNNNDSDFQLLKVPNGFKVYINGELLNQAEVRMPKDNLVQLAFVSDKFQPFLYWGKMADYPEFTSEPLATKQCGNLNSFPKNADYSFVLLRQKNCDAAISTTESPQMGRPRWHYYAAGLIALGVAGVYLAGYEFVLLF